MGCWNSKSVDEGGADISRQIDRQIKEEEKNNWREVKLLLLGTGESGKSTIVKQMKIINENGYNEKERLKFRTTVFHNTIQSLIVIIRAMAKLGIEFSDTERLNDAQSLLQMAGTVERNDPMNPDLLIALKNLWADEGVQACFLRSREYQLIDSAEYYLNQLDALGAKNYIPSEQDILRTRVTTTGIIETVVIYNDLRMRLVDVGGQRTERRKWIHCFDNVHAIIFIVALSEYDLMLFEDPEVNRMNESLRLFDSMCNNPLFKKTCMILFLNKKDLFAQKICKSPLTICFPEFVGENNYDNGLHYIRMKFEQTNKFPQTKAIYIHETCATDTDNVRRVFENIKSIMRAKLLEGQGLL